MNKLSTLIKILDFLKSYWIVSVSIITFITGIVSKISAWRDKHGKINKIYNEINTLSQEFKKYTVDNNMKITSMEDEMSEIKGKVDVLIAINKPIDS